MKNPSTMKIWLQAARLQTLPAGLAPVILGTAMAFGDGVHHWPSAFAALTGALAIQIGTNFANDYFDFVKGSDTPERKGPLRVTQAGLVSPWAMKCAIVLTFLIAALISYWLILRAGWPMLYIAIFSILAGIFYTAGPYPLGYLGLGDILVLIFFGPVAVGGTYYVQSFELNPAVLLAGLATGLFSTAILVVNNIRDRQTDAQSGKKTLAVRFGRVFAAREYFICCLSGGLMPAVIYLITFDHVKTLYSLSVCLFALPGIEAVFTKEGASLNQILAFTGRLLLFFVIMFSWGWCQ
jgi:1,4-dihydroxy-2-naphthoate polyprenyltransferase